MEEIDNSQTCQADEKLGGVLNLVESTHVGILVFKDEKFVGLCSPYQTLYKERNPYYTAVENCLVNPPRITVETNIFELAAQMLSLRIYTLPVFDKDGEVVGIVKAGKIIRELLSDDIKRGELVENLTISPITTGEMDLKVRDIYALMRQKNTSRVAIVDEWGKLVGIVARSDIKHAFTHPTPMQRFSKRRGSPVSHTFDPKEKISELDNSVKSYYNEFVSFASDNINLVKIVQEMFRVGRNSIVIVDEATRPVGIISLRTLLQALAKMKPKHEINVEFERPKAAIPEKNIEKAIRLLNEYGEKLNRRIPVGMIRVSFDIPKFTTREAASFFTSLRIEPIRGKIIVAKAQGEHFLQSVRSAMKLIERQLQKEHQVNHLHRRQSVRFAFDNRELA